MSSGLWPLRRLAKIAFPSAVGALGIMLLALGLRLYRLADNNIWWDEGWTIWLSQLDLGQIALRTASDEHPPLHYWLMHFWLGGLGASAFAGRLFSAFFGILGVAVIYRLAKQAGGARLGVLAALLLALSRFHILWSQDIKNYTLSGFFASASVWCAFTLFTNRQAASGGRRWLWLGYVLAGTLAIYSHYLAALVFVANNLFVALILARRWQQGRKPLREFIHWSLAQLAVLAGVAPWLAVYWTHAQAWSAAQAFDFGFFLQVTATLFTLGVTTYLEQYVLQVVFLVVLAGIGLLWLVRGILPRAKPDSPSRRYRLALGALLGLILVSVPPLLVYLLSLMPVAIFHPKMQPRYLLVFLPGYVLLLTLGIGWLARLSRPLGAAIAVAAVIVQSQPLLDYYQGRKLRDDYFTLANTINAFARPGDLVLLNTDQEWPTFLYYLHTPIPWSGISREPMTEDRAAALASQATANSEAVWLVTVPDALAQDPQHLLPARLASARPRQFEREFGDSLLSLYASVPRDLNEVPVGNFSPQHPIAIPFTPDVRLVGFDLATREPYGGDTVRVVTYWSAGDPVTVTVEIQDAKGASVRADSQVVQRGSRYRIQSDLRLPPRAAGAYSVVARVDATPYRLAALQVAPRPRPPAPGRIDHPLDYDLGEAIRLRGYNLPRATRRPGEKLALTLFWYSREPTPVSYKVFVQLVGTEFNAAQSNFLWGQVDAVPSGGRFATNRWEAGDLVPDNYEVSIAPAAPPGAYQLLVGMYDPVTGQRLRVTNLAGEDLGDAVQIGIVTITP